MTDQSTRYYRVVAIVANVKQFRRPFYEQLVEALARSGIEFSVLYSAPDPVEAGKGDSIDLPASLGRKVPRRYLANNRVLLQFPPLGAIAQADLVIVVQATGYLLNYPLLALSGLGLKRIAFWGHGLNRQGDASSFSERIKRRLACAVDWWFAYTQQTARYLASVGMDPARITMIENAVDTREFRSAVASVTDAEIADMRSRLGLTSEHRVALYCGSLYSEKRVPYLLEMAAQAAALIPGFRLLVVGSGNEAHLVREYANGHSSVIYAGPLFSGDKAACFRLSEVFVCPGLVGLGILDSFAAGLPMVTTKDALHSPEIDYLVHGVNGLMVDGGAAEFAHTVVELLRNPVQLARLAQGASQAAEHYTVENMVANVVRGILACLGHRAAPAAEEGRA
jgi:glycosyltransferase involved in cell wall biosynthesis